MKPILSKKNLPVLENFVTGKILVAFDFDGTIAPLTSEPDRASIRPATRLLLRTLGLLYPCIVVTGRSHADVRRRLRGIGFQEIIGNHGIEPGSSSPAFAQAVESWIPVLRERMKPFHGVLLENKRFSLSVHYRHENRKTQARKAIAKAAQLLPGATLMGGKQVVNILPEGAPNKGRTVERVRKRRRLDAVIYVGDDETDETVFARLPLGRYLTIRVGMKKASRARFYIRNQGEIDRLLKILIKLRQDR